MVKKKLMVVYDESYKDYATILSGLISAKDDIKDGEKTVIVGTEDDTVEMGMMTDKQYLANKPQFSSIQKILFIGDVDAKNGLGTVMKVLYKKHGVVIGCHGNMMLVTTDVKELYALTGSPYADFINDFKKYDVPIAKERRKLEWNAKTTLKALIDFFVLKMPVFVGSDISHDIILSQKQQRVFAIYELYMNYLDKFMKA